MPRKFILAPGRGTLEEAIDVIPVSRRFLLLDRFAKEPPLQQGDDHERDKDEYSHDGGVAKAEVFEGGVIEQHDDRLARARRSALRGGVNLVEDLEIEY